MHCLSRLLTIQIYTAEANTFNPIRLCLLLFGFISVLLVGALRLKFKDSTDINFTAGACSPTEKNRQSESCIMLGHLCDRL